MAVLAIPMMQAQLAATSKVKSKSDRTSRNYVLKGTPMQAMEWGVRPATPQLRAGESYLWDFETNDSFTGWSTYDADQDGRSWMIDDSGESAHSGMTSLVSESYVWGQGALDPDNWLISPEVPLNGFLSFWTMNYISYWPDMIAVYVCVGEPEYISDFVLVRDNILPGEDWEEIIIDLSEFGGQMGHFAFRHYDSYDNMMIYIDDVALLPPAVTTPVNLTADAVDPYTIEATWEDPENAAWNLRYREVVPGLDENLLWDFEEDTYDNTDISLTGGWTSIDADGDGNDWYHLYGVAGLKSHSGTGHVTSASYNGDALDPDNWLVSPMVKLDGELSFWAASQDASWPENFAVYASTDMLNWEPLSGDITAPGEMTQFTFDLTPFQGVEGYVAIRHYDCYDNFRLNIDDIAITYVQPSDWIYVENLNETNYTIDGLNPETEYEVEVQAINEEGATSDWTASAFATTPAVAEIVQTDPPVGTYWEGENGDHTVYVEFVAPTEDCEMEYRYKYGDEEFTEWMSYDEIITFTEDGKYVVEGRARAEGEEWSEPSNPVEFVITPRTGIDEINGVKAVASVRYFNAIGQEMAQPNGVTIVVTTYTDGTTTTAKVIK